MTEDERARLWKWMSNHAGWMMLYGWFWFLTLCLTIAWQIDPPEPENKQVTTLLSIISFLIPLVIHMLAWAIPRLNRGVVRLRGKGKS